MVDLEKGIEYLQDEFWMVIEKDQDGYFECRVPVGWFSELVVRTGLDVSWFGVEDSWIEDEEAYLFYVKSDGLEEVCSRLSKEMEA